MDLSSTIIRLRARQSARGLSFLGRHVQAWFLREIRRHAPEVADQLHDEPHNETAPSILRPYTLSTLMKGEYPPREITAGDWCYIRITSLTQELSGLLIDQVLPNLLPQNFIGKLEFELESWRNGPPDRALFQTDSYASLLSRTKTSSETRVSMEFTSPTTFSQMNKSGIDIDYPLPAPDKVFGSYQKHWSAFSGAAIEPEFGEFLGDCLAINELRIRSERVQFSQKETRRAATGFVGRVRFAILGNREENRFGADWGHYSNILRVLALYSFYCGTGSRTTEGLGQTRPLSSSW